MRAAVVAQSQNGRVGERTAPTASPAVRTAGRTKKPAAHVSVKVHDVAIVPAADTVIDLTAAAPTVLEEEAAQALLEFDPHEEHRAN